MNRRKGLLRLVFPLFVLSLISPFPPALAQGPRVVVTSIGDRDLKRTAHRLRISTSQLKHARQALQEATSLAGRVNGNDYWQLGQLGQLWIQLDRSKAAGAIESIFGDLRSAAAGAPDDGAYQQACNVAQGVVSALLQIDLKRAQQLAQQWPSPPARLGAPAQAAYKNFQKGLESFYLNRLALEDPDGVPAALADPRSQPGYSVRAQLVSQLLGRNRKEQALKIVDDTVMQFAQSNSDSASFQDFAQFVQQLSWSTPDQFERAFSMMLSHLDDPPQPGEQDFRIPVGSHTIELTARESAVLNVFRSMCARPEMTARVLDQVPGLRGKLNPIGGVDYYLNPQLWPVKEQPAAKDPYRLSQDWANQARGKASRNPSLLYEKLAELPDAFARVNALITLAQQTAYEDPDFSYQVLQSATPLFPQIESLEQRAQLLQQLMMAYQNLEGEVDAAVLHEGFALLDQLRKNENEKNALKDKPRSGGSPADQFELALTAQWARSDFEGALRRLNSTADDGFRFRALVGIAQALAY
ncbi:MAG TPA: hypothetical protein VGL91_25615 [Acidobacteriota bacterium]|jgi:hypothetical protein